MGRGMVCPVIRETALLNGSSVLAYQSKVDFASILFGHVLSEKACLPTLRFAICPWILVSRNCHLSRRSRISVTTAVFLCVPTKVWQSVPYSHSITASVHLPQRRTFHVRSVNPRPD